MADAEGSPQVQPNTLTLSTPAAVHHDRGRTLFKVLLEVVLISTGVFLGLAGEQWRQDRQQRELARTSLRRFGAEIQTNRKAVAAVKDYHATLLQSLKAYLAKDRKGRNTADVQIRGLQFVAFEHTAWDLALATQALTYLDPELAFALSRIYNVQTSYSEFTRGMTQAMYLLPFRENFDAFAGAAEAYYGDAVYYNARLLEMYDEALQRISRTLGESLESRSAP
ncbi:MAG: hypothetical protein WBC51_03455 [Vicinamibacterales bacterium]|jgi:hypothetical protein